MSLHVKGRRFRCTRLTCADALIDVDSGRLLNQVLREMAADEILIPQNVAVLYDVY